MYYWNTCDRRINVWEKQWKVYNKQTYDGGFARVRLKNVALGYKSVSNNVNPSWIQHVKIRTKIKSKSLDTFLNHIYTDPLTHIILSNSLYIKM